MKKRKDEAVKGLRECCRRIESLKSKPASSPEFLSWRKDTEELLNEIFGVESAEAREFNSIYYTPLFLTCRMGDEAFAEACREGLEKAERLLSGLCSRLSSRGHGGPSPS